MASILQNVVVPVHSTPGDFDMTELLKMSSTYREKYTTVDEDLLILSCCAFRLKNQYMSLDDERLPGFVLPEDIELATKIKKHYSQKLMMMKLRNVRLSQYREDLNKFIHSDFIDPKGSGRHIYPDKYLGMAYKLPYFYIYDLQILDLFGANIRPLNSSKVVVLPRTNRQTKTLNFVKKIKSYISKDKSYEFWFTDEVDNLVKLNIEENNPLMCLFEHLLDKPINITGKFEQRHKEQMHYYSVVKWTVGV